MSDRRLHKKPLRKWQTFDPAYMATQFREKWAQIVVATGDHRHLVENSRRQKRVVASA